MGIAMLKRIYPRAVKTAFLCLLTAAFAFSGTGCLQAHSVDQYGYVLAIGFDVGKTLPYEITLVLQKSEQTGDSQKSVSYDTVSAECRSLFEAIETVTGNLPFQLDFARARLLGFSREIAQQEGAMEKLLDISFAELRFRYNANLFISFSTAKEALESLKSGFDPSLSKIQKDLVNHSRESGLIPSANLTRFFESMEGKAYHIALPLCGVEPETPMMRTMDSVGEREYAYIGGSLLIDSDMKTGLAGSAIFAGSRMVGVLDGQHTQLLLLASGDFTEGRVRMKGLNGEEMSVYLRTGGKPERSITLGERLRAEITVKVIADVEMPGTIIKNEAAALERHIKETLEAQFPPVFETCRSLGSDVFGLGALAVTHFSDTKAWEAYDWRAAYANAEAVFHVDIRLEHNPGKSFLE